MGKHSVRLALLVALGSIAGCFLQPGFAQAQERELKIAYQKHPIQDASLAMFEKWGQANGVKVTKIPVAYDVYLEKLTATLTSGDTQFDIIWHNDDWGQSWKKWLEPTDDIPGMKVVSQEPVQAAFMNDDNRPTVVPMVHTVGTFFYRSDLLKPNEVPTTWAQLVQVSKRLQAEGKVKWGYVGGMSMNNTWFTFWWATWGNQCDIFTPAYSRDNKKLAASGWKPMIGDPCETEVVTF